MKCPDCGNMLCCFSLFKSKCLRKNTSNRQQQQQQQQQQLQTVKNGVSNNTHNNSYNPTQTTTPTDYNSTLPMNQVYWLTFIALQFPGYSACSQYSHFCADRHLSFMCFFIYYYLLSIASSMLLNCYQWGSCLPCDTPTKEPCIIE